MLQGMLITTTFYVTYICASVYKGVSCFACRFVKFNFDIPASTVLSTKKDVIREHYFFKKHPVHFNYVGKVVAAQIIY
jgi:hypothetical protein